MLGALSKLVELNQQHKIQSSTHRKKEQPRGQLVCSPGCSLSASAFVFIGTKVMIIKCSTADALTNCDWLRLLRVQRNNVKICTRQKLLRLHIIAMCERGGPQDGKPLLALKDEDPHT